MTIFFSEGTFGSNIVSQSDFEKLVQNKGMFILQ
jgi:hypothetical protein